MAHSVLRPLVFWLTIGTLGAVITGCGDGGGGSGGPSSGFPPPGSPTADLSTFSLNSVPGAVLPTWASDRSLDLYYSSDPDCNWSSYGSCPQSGLLVDVDSGARIGRSDGLELGRNYAFAVSDGQGYSDVMGGHAMPPSPSELMSSPVGGHFDYHTRLHVHEGRLYAIGHFQSGTPLLNGFIYDPTDEHPVGVPGREISDYTAVTSDGESGWFVAGYRDTLATHAVRRIRSNGFAKPGWEVPVDGPVSTLLVAGDRLILAGDFSAVDGVARGHLAALDLSSGTLQNTLPSPNGPVLSLALDDDTLYLGGEFTQVDNAPREHLAAIDLTTDDLSDWQAETNGAVRALAALDQHLAVGGSFTEVEGDPQAYLAVLSKASSTEPVSVVDDVPQPDAPVHALATLQNRLYLGGEFEHIGINDRRHLAALEMDDYAVASTGLESPPGVVGHLVASNDELYISAVSASSSGRFRGPTLSAYRPGDSHFRRDLGVDMVWHVSDLPDLSEPPPPATAPVLATAEGRLYVGGYGTQHPTAGLAIYDLETDAFLENTPRFGQLERLRLALGFDGPTVYTVSGSSLRLGSFDANTLERSELDINVDTNSRYIYTLEVLGDRLFVGGSGPYLTAFDLTGSEPVEIAGWAPNWSNGRSSFTRVAHVAGDDQTLYVAGDFSSAAEEDRPGLAALNQSDGQLLDWQPGPTLSQFNLNDIAVHENMLYAAGVMEEEGDSTRMNLAAFRTDTDAPGFEWSAESATSWSVSAQDGWLAHSGTFNASQEEPRTGLAVFELGTTGSHLSTLAPQIQTHYRPQVEIDEGVLYILAPSDDNDPALAPRMLQGIDLVTGERVF